MIYHLIIIFNSIATPNYIMMENKNVDIKALNEKIQKESAPYNFI